MAKDKTEVKEKKRSKQKESHPEEMAVEEKVLHKGEATISTKRKKKKKELMEENEQNDITEGEAKMENGDKKKKKKRKMSQDISAVDGEHIKGKECLEGEANLKRETSETEEQHADADTKKTKKKKKNSQQLEDLKSEEVVDVVCGGGKKKKNRESLPAGHDGDTSGQDLGEEASVMTLKKKKKKKKQTDENTAIEENGAENTTHENQADMTANIPDKGKGKKRKKAAKAEDTCALLEQAILEKQEKKKKKKKKITEEENLEEDPSTTSTSTVEHTEQKKRKKGKKTESHAEDVTHTAAGVDPGISEEKNTEDKPKKRKKEKDVSVNTDVPELEQNHTEEEKKKQKKKKAKKEPVEEAVQQPVTQEEEDEGDGTGPVVVNGKKRKKSQQDLSEACTQEETTPLKKKEKKKKKKQQQLSEEGAPAKAVKREETPRSVSAEEHQEVTEVVFLSEKPGNQDEILIDQERRLALQREIDKESQPKAGFGQWGTATFDNAGQQQKFLRLMGGFKKSSQTLGTSAGRPNMALGKEEQQNLQHKLLGQFQQAQNRRMDFSNKGAGLGFVAPSTKKFAIDVNASRSIKFDD